MSTDENSLAREAADAAEEAYVDMTRRIEAVITDFDKLVEGELADLNTAAAAASIPVTIV